MDGATWRELRSGMALELQPAHPVAVGLLSSNFGSSEHGVQLCQADACMVLDEFDEWGSVAASLGLHLTSFCFPPSKEQLKFSSASACSRIKSCKDAASVASTDLRHGLHLECSLLQSLAVLWVNPCNIQWVFQSKIIQRTIETALSGIGPLCFRWSSNSFLKIIHGEPFKYEFVFLSFVTTLGTLDLFVKALHASCRSFKSLFLGWLGIISEMHMWHRVEEIHGVLTKQHGWLLILIPLLFFNPKWQLPGRSVQTNYAKQLTAVRVYLQI